MDSQKVCISREAAKIAKKNTKYTVISGNLFYQKCGSFRRMRDQMLNHGLDQLKKMQQAPVTYEIPREVVAEAIVNAVAHRDYTSTGSIQVMLFSDRLEVWSPGELRPPMTIAKLSKPHPSIPINPLIAEPLFLSKYIEKAGSGTLDMLAQCQFAGLRPPEFRMDVGCFIVTIHRRQQPESRPELQSESAPGRDQVGTRQEPSREQEGTKQALSKHQVDTRDTEQVAGTARLESRIESQLESQLGSIRDRVIRLLSKEMLSKSEISKRLGQKQTSGQLNKVMWDLLAEGIIAYSMPEKPASRLQKYKLIKKDK